MAKKIRRKKAVVHRKKGSDFFGYNVGNHPVFVISVGLLIITVIFAFVQYFAR